MNGTAPETYNDYFKQIEHNIYTRNNGENVMLPKMKTESRRNRSCFKEQNFLTCYHLPITLKEELSITKFRSKVQDTFKA
jgi:hypothetical protein